MHVGKAMSSVARRIRHATPPQEDDQDDEDKEEQQPFYVPFAVPQTQDSDDEMPDLQALASSKKPAAKPRPLSRRMREDEEAELVPKFKVKTGRARRRPVIEDSDDE